MVKRRLRGQLLSPTTTQRAGKMMVVAGNKTRDSLLKLQLGTFRLNTKTGFIRQHSNRCSEGELCPCRFTILEWTKPQLLYLVLIIVPLAGLAWTKERLPQVPSHHYL